TSGSFSLVTLTVVGQPTLLEATLNPSFARLRFAAVTYASKSTWPGFTLAARVKPGQVLFEAYVTAANLGLAKDGFKVASSKVGCPTTVRVTRLKEPEVVADD
ncbi:MAG TPA: hypothetical protein VJ742_00085, partial [Nitrososphaera sp.]|nr:hypothetical protein [Nitrososphaera sp.]